MNARLKRKILYKIPITFFITITAMLMMAGFAFAATESGNAKMKIEASSGTLLAEPEDESLSEKDYADHTGIFKNEKDGKSYYIENGKIASDLSGLKYIDETWYYFDKGVWQSDYTGLVNHYGGWYYVEKGVINWNYSNLVYYNKGWFYVKNGVIDWKYSNLVYYNKEWFYVHNGKIDWTYNTLSQVNGKGNWYYVEKGKINWSYTGLSKYNSAWFYIEKGKLNWNYTGLVKYNGGWFYVEKGVLNWKYTGLTKYYNTWYYVEKGALNWNYTGLVYHYGSWYYVEKGVLNWKYTGLTKYYSTWYYVEKGVLNWKYNGLVNHYGGWYYIENGKITWNYTNLVSYNGTYYYVSGSKIDWTYTGKAQLNQKDWYYVQNGKAVTGAFKLSDGKYYRINSSTGEIYASKAVVVVDAGHQSVVNYGTEPLGPGSSTTKRKVSTGTVGSATGQAEYSVNLAIALKLQAILEADGYTVIMTRTTDNVDISNAERAQIANNANAAAFVRIHADGSTNPSVSGATALCQTKSNPYNGSMAGESYKLSSSIVNNLSAATGCKNNGVSQVDNMTGINWSKVPVSIVEVGFLTNANEDKALATDSYRQKVAQGIANGIEAYINSK
jgi:N-acetylmuramoyl-L-alanine amidase